MFFGLEYAQQTLVDANYLRRLLDDIVCLCLVFAQQTP